MTESRKRSKDQGQLIRTVQGIGRAVASTEQHAANLERNTRSLLKRAAKAQAAEEATSSREAEAQQRERRTNRRMGVWNASVSVVASLVAVYSAYLALEANTGDRLTQAFAVTAAACVSVESDVPLTNISSMTQTFIATNTGRLPITIVDFRESDVEGRSFSWLPLDDSGSDARTDAAVRLDVGDAVAVRVVTPGHVTRPMEAVRSDGEVVLLDWVNGSEAVPQYVAAAFARLPDGCG